MKQPIYLPLRDRMVIRHAADLLAEELSLLWKLPVFTTLYQDIPGV